MSNDGTRRLTNISPKGSQGLCICVFWAYVANLRGRVGWKHLANRRMSNGPHFTFLHPCGSSIVWGEQRPCCQACNSTWCVRFTKTRPNIRHRSATLLSRLMIQEITEQRTKVCKLGCLLWIIAKLSLRNCCSRVWGHKLRSVGHLPYKVPDQTRSNPLLVNIYNNLCTHGARIGHKKVMFWVNHVYTRGVTSPRSPWSQ